MNKSSLIILLTKRLKNNKVLLRNFTYLSFLKVFNMVIPLITYPYLIRVLGKETYGLVIFAQAVIGYLVILVGFGFNISATKEISIHRNNKNKLSEIISSVLLIKIILFFLSCLILFGLVLVLPQAKGYEILFFLTMWMCLYESIFPVWYFQGIENMKFITFLNLTSRLIFVFFIFIFIRSSNDFLFIPIINGFGALISSFIALYIVFYKDQIEFKIPTINTLKFYLKDSFPIFISNVSIQIYTSTNKVIAGLFLGMSEVSYYDLAEKITSLLKTPIFILNQAIFPKVSREKNRIFIIKIFRYLISFGVVFITPLLVLTPYIINILGGAEMHASITIVRILILTVIPVIISIMFANIYLLAWGHTKIYMKIRLYSTLLYFIIITFIIFTETIHLNSLAYITIGVESFIAMLSIFYYKNLIKKDEN